MARGDFPRPPSDVTGALGVWLDEVWKYIVSTPSLSYFSGTNPNSSMTGVAGNIAVNVTGASNVSRVFVKYGSASAPDKSSWATIG